MPCQAFTDSYMNLDDTGPGLHEIDVSSFEESSNGSDISSLGSESDDLDPSAELYHDSTASFDGQGGLQVADTERTNLSEEQIKSNDDVSELESDDEVNKTA